jgi:hypothetical protein
MPTYAHVQGTMSGLGNGWIGDKFSSELGTLFAALAIDITMVGVAIGQSLQEVDHAEDCLFFRDGGLCEFYFHHLSSSWPLVCRGLCEFYFRIFLMIGFWFGILYLVPLWKNTTIKIIIQTMEPQCLASLPRNCNQWSLPRNKTLCILSEIWWKGKKCQIYFWGEEVSTTLYIWNKIQQRD